MSDGYVSPSGLPYEELRRRPIQVNLPAVVKPRGNVWAFPGAGSTTEMQAPSEALSAIRDELHGNKPQLSEWPASTLCGNDLLSSCLFSSGIVTSKAGKLAPVPVLLVAVVLYFFRFIYEEAVSAIPLNGGSYNVLLNTTSKRMASFGAALAIISYLATCVVAASSGVNYLASVVSLPILTTNLAVLLVFALLSLFGITDSSRVALVIFVHHVVVLSVLVVASFVYAVQHTNIFTDNMHSELPQIAFAGDLIDSNFATAIFFGFGGSMLGVTGFETSAQFVEDQKPGVFRKTLRNMWIFASVFNTALIFLVLATLPMDAIYASKDYLLGEMGEVVLGHWFKVWIAVDALAVLRLHILPRTPQAEFLPIDDDPAGQSVCGPSKSVHTLCFTTVESTRASAESFIDGRPLKPGYGNYGQRSKITKMAPMDDGGNGGEATAEERMQGAAEGPVAAERGPPAPLPTGATNVEEAPASTASPGVDGAAEAEKSPAHQPDPPEEAENTSTKPNDDDRQNEDATAKANADDDKTSSASLDDDGDAMMREGARVARAPPRTHKKVEDFYRTLVEHFKHAMVEDDADNDGMALAAELFEFLYAEVRKHGTVPKTQSELPATTTQQQQRLLTLLRTLIAEKQSSLQRVEAALSELIQAVFRSKWTLDQLLEDRVTRAQVPSAPPSTAWGRPDEKKTSAAVDPRLSADMAPFRFDASVYNPTDVMRLKALCMATHGFAEKPRKPTEDEWTIIWGLMNGTILMRVLPQFLKRCCTMKQFQWLHHYMVVAVEGELYAKLPQQSPVFDVNQTSKRLADNIRAAVVHKSFADRERVYAMLRAVKVISYNKERHALHFHFFTKKEAIEWENLSIPFRNSVLQLKNPDARYREVTVDEKGVERVTFKPPTDGVRDDRYQDPYKFRLTNITRTTEVDKIAQFLQQITDNGLRIGVPVDTYGQGSEHSLVWEFFGLKASCPPALASINRILWRDHAILVVHRAGSAYAPRYKCARLGHQEAHCPTPEAEWINETTLVVTDPEIAALETERAIWKSQEEAKTIFERLGQDTLVAQTATQAQPPATESQQKAPTEPKDSESQQSQQVNQAMPVHLQTPREQVTTEWTTVMSKRGRGKSTTKESITPQPAGVGKSTPKHRRRNQNQHKKGEVDTSEGVIDLANDATQEEPAKESDDENDDEQEAEEARGNTKILESANDQTDAPRQSPPQHAVPHEKDKDKAETELLNNARARSNMERIGLAMTALAQKHRKHLDAGMLLATLQAKLPDVGDKASTAWLLEALSAQIAKTPMTGNCQPFAMAEALLQLNMKGMLDDAVALELAMLLKFGMYLAHQVDHESELGISYIAALQDNVAADPEAIRKYFEDLAVSSSERTSILPKELWGGHDTLRMAAKLLDRRIDLIIETDDPTTVYVMHFQPQRVRDHRTKVLFESAVLVQPGIQSWLETICDDLRAGKLPIVLHYSPKAEHYSAVLMHREPVPTSEKRQTDLRDHLNPVRSINDHINSAKKSSVKKREASADDEYGPTRKMLIESQSEITPQTALSALTQRNWTREEKKIVIDCLVSDPSALKALLTFCGPDSQESEASVQCAQDTPDMTGHAASSDSSFHPSESDNDSSSGSDDEEAPYAFPTPQRGRPYTTWVKRKWKEMQDEWAEQDAGTLPPLDDLEALHDFAVKHPDELAAAGQLFPNPFRFLDHFENDGLQNWMRPRWLKSCMKALLDRVDQISDPGVREEAREALRFVDDSPTMAVRLRKWQQKKLWRLLKAALPSSFKGPQAIPFLAETMSLQATCVFVMDAVMPMLARDLQSLEADQVMEPKSLAQLYHELPAFRAALDASVDNNAWDDVENYLHNLKFPVNKPGPARRC